MHERNRFTDIALGLGLGVCLAFLFLVWSFPGFRNPTYQQDPYYNSENNETGERNPLIRPSFWETYTKPTDTYAQWIMAVFSVVATGFSVWAVLLVRQTLRETSRAADITQEAFLNDQRPWLDFKLHSFRFVQFETQIVIFTTFQVRNIGKSPAFGVRIGSVNTVDSKNISRFAFEAVDNVTGSLIEAPIILMGDNGYIDRNIVFDKDRLEVFEDGFKPILIIVALTYNNSVGPSQHATVKTFILHDEAGSVQSDFGDVFESKAITFRTHVTDSGIVTRSTKLDEQNGRRDYK